MLIFRYALFDERNQEPLCVKALTKVSYNFIVNNRVDSTICNICPSVFMLLAIRFTYLFGMLYINQKTDKENMLVAAV